MTYVFDILVIGGGHAGVEAALIARKMGRQVGLVSLDHSKTGGCLAIRPLEEWAKPILLERLML